MFDEKRALKTIHKDMMKLVHHDNFKIRSDAHDMEIAALEWLVSLCFYFFPCLFVCLYV
jgi:hypothetical protein